MSTELVCVWFVLTYAHYDQVGEKAAKPLTSVQDCVSTIVSATPLDICEGNLCKISSRERGNERRIFLDEESGRVLPGLCQQKRLFNPKTWSNQVVFCAWKPNQTISKFQQQQLLRGL